jgi:hypothetical protein
MKGNLKKYWMKANRTMRAKSAPSRCYVGADNSKCRKEAQN